MFRIALIACLMWTAATRAEPARVVSLNPCLDTILLGVADRAQIAALSHYSRDGNNFTNAADAATLPTTTGAAEEVAALRPDLVLTGLRFAPATQGAFARLAIPVAVLPLPETVTDSISQVRTVAAFVGRPDRGEVMIAAIESALAKAAPPAGAAPIDALVFQSNGFASAPGTLMDDLMGRAGFANVARRYGLTQSGHVPLETVMADPPHVLLVGQRRPGMPAWADRVIGHPALLRLGRRVTLAPFPAKYLYCGGPVIALAAEALAAARPRPRGAP